MLAPEPDVSESAEASMSVFRFEVMLTLPDALIVLPPVSLLFDVAYTCAMTTEESVELASDQSVVSLLGSWLVQGPDAAMSFCAAYRLSMNLTMSPFE